MQQFKHYFRVALFFIVLPVTAWAGHSMNHLYLFNHTNYDAVFHIGHHSVVVPPFEQRLSPWHRVMRHCHTETTYHDCQVRVSLRNSPMQWLVGSAYLNLHSGRLLPDHFSSHGFQVYSNHKSLIEVSE